ncbi:chemotaxis protein CheW [Pseudomonas turukhanskensis]|uniref:Chemotaxis protein CheW n=1 Tax=Pseudomonas turukhanskensis TaxID=1806536 RepID=A0A9W6NFQ8_9PSED|nr:chemotaxis protein CheW [Pseudomonas turukhanskensis]GLK89065.1 chemotaxis protein CheW [Pseudomonas turukhanskensis]
MTEVSLSLHGGELTVDDCWNRIGVRGDKSCPKLIEHVHCRNCEVYAAAATRLLDRYSLSQEHVALYDQDKDTEAQVTRSMIVFRLGDEWLALATRTLVEVSPLAPIHSLPHQRSRALLGVANVRGALVPCVSLTELLGLDAAAGKPSGRIVPRLLILAAQGGNVVAPVDEVLGIQAFPEQALDAASASQAGSAASGKFTRGVLQWQQRSVRLLDEDLLLHAVMRSLT